MADNALPVHQRKPPRFRLTRQQSIFINEYLKDGNGTQAAIRAGYCAKTATVQASRLLTLAKVCQEIDRRQKNLLRRSEMSADEWRSRLTTLARADMRRLVDPETGQLKPIQELDDEAAAMLSSVDVSRERTRIKTIGDAEVTTEESIVKVRLHDPLKALELYGRHLGLLADQRIDIHLDLGERIAEARKRVKGGGR